MQRVKNNQSSKWNKSSEEDSEESSEENVDTIKEDSKEQEDDKGNNTTNSETEYSEVNTKGDENGHLGENDEEENNTGDHCNKGENNTFLKEENLNKADDGKLSTDPRHL